MRKSAYFYFAFLMFCLLIGLALKCFISTLSIISILFYVILFCFLFSFLFIGLEIYHEYRNVQQKIENHSEVFFEQCKNFLSQVKIDLEQKEIFSPLYYDDIQRKCIYLYNQLVSFQEKLSKRYRKTWSHYLSNIEEMEEYIEELKNNLFLSYLFETMKSEHPLWEHLHILPQSSKEIVSQSLVFLEDYFDILLLEIYPFLSKNKRKNYWHRVKRWQNESNF